MEWDILPRKIYETMKIKNEIWFQQFKGIFESVKCLSLFENGCKFVNFKVLTCYSCVFGKHNYRVLIRAVCVCVCVCVCVHVCDSAAGRRGSYFQAQALYLGLKTS